MAKPEKPYKVGRLKKSEEQYIFANNDKMPPDEIAKKLNRSLTQVLNTLSKIPSLPKSQSPEVAELRLGLKESALWKSLKQEHDPDELVYFEEQYIALMSQFKQGNEEVLHTEENQVFKVIKLDILKHRNSMRQKRCKNEIERCEKVYDMIVKSGKLDDKQKAELATLELSISNYLAQQSQFSTEYVKLEEKHQKLMEAMKATRDQRVDKIISSKIDFLGLLRSLGEDNIQEENDKYIEMMRRATKTETERLTKLHTYNDGEEDSPVLLPESFLEEK